MYGDDPKCFFKKQKFLLCLKRELELMSDFFNLTGQTDEKQRSTKFDILNVLFQLSSAYSPEIMPFTNYTFDFRGMIDYVFYDTKTLQPLGLLGPFSDEWMSENKVVGCPHPHIHSGKKITRFIKEKNIPVVSMGLTYC